MAENIRKKKVYTSDDVKTLSSLILENRDYQSTIAESKMFRSEIASTIFDINDIESQFMEISEEDKEIIADYMDLYTIYKEKMEKLYKVNKELSKHVAQIKSELTKYMEKYNLSNLVKGSTKLSISKTTQRKKNTIGKNNLKEVLNEALGDSRKVEEILKSIEDKSNTFLSKNIIKTERI